MCHYDVLFIFCPVNTLVYVRNTIKSIKTLLDVFTLCCCIDQIILWKFSQCDTTVIKFCSDILILIGRATVEIEP